MRQAEHHRRSQNRANQAAFRKRKEDHVAFLQRQLDGLIRDHCKLEEDHTVQDLVIVDLHRKIAVLSQEVNALRALKARPGLGRVMMEERLNGLRHQNSTNSNDDSVIGMPANRFDAYPMAWDQAFLQMAPAGDHGTSGMRLYNISAHGGDWTAPSKTSADWNMMSTNAASLAWPS
jgi:hypothetical protein